MRDLLRASVLIVAGATQAFAGSAPIHLTGAALPVGQPQLGVLGSLLAAPGESSLAPTPTSSWSLSLTPAVPALPAVPEQRLVAARPEDGGTSPAVMPALETLAGKAQVKEQGQDAAAVGRFYDLGGFKAAPEPAGLPSAQDAVAAEGDFGAQFRAPYDPKGRIDLAQYNPDRAPGYKHDPDKALERLKDEQTAMAALQERLYAEGKRSVLIVLQAMDSGGKDGIVRRVLAGLNPQWLKIAGFKKPTPQEAKHHFLWRIKNALPVKGIIGLFNRSHYEDILVPTVYRTFSAHEVAGRYEEINAFEKRLADRGVVILKFFLNISKDEQKARLQERLDDPSKNWKFSAADLESRKHWDAFQQAYGKVLARTSTPWAPWHIIPANKKWYRNYAVARIIKEAMERMSPQYPEPAFDPKRIKIPE